MRRKDQGGSSRDRGVPPAGFGGGVRSSHAGFVFCRESAVGQRRGRAASSSQTEYGDLADQSPAAAISPVPMILDLGATWRGRAQDGRLHGDQRTTRIAHALSQGRREPGPDPGGVSPQPGRRRKGPGQALARILAGMSRSIDRTPSWPRPTPWPINRPGPARREAPTR